MLISTPEELRAFLPNHLYRNLDPMRGFLQTSENTFLRQRIGQPLLDALRAKYAEIGPIIPDPFATMASTGFRENTDTAITPDPWPTLITLCQGCIVFDAFNRAADVLAVSVNDSGLNVADSEGYDAANDKRIDRYKAQLIKESHAAVDQLLIQLEEWEAIVGKSNEESNASQSNEESGESNVDTPSDEDSTLPITHSPLLNIISLWQQSPVCLMVDGLLFNTASEFHRYVDIYDSRDRFITLLPDIRFCQELHLEAELSPELLHHIITEHRHGRYEGSEQKIAWMMLQRSLSLYVEARAKMFTRNEARDEATGYMRLTLNYIRRNQRHIAPREVFEHSPLFEPHHWPRPEAEADDAEAPTDTTPAEGAEAPTEARPPHHVAPNLHGRPVPTHPHHGHGYPYGHGNHDGDSGMLITSII